MQNNGKKHNLISRFNLTTIAILFSQWWLDYIMFLTDHKQPTSSTYEIMEAKTNTKMRMCWDPNSLNIGAYRFPDTLECHDTEKFDELSDHYPIVADFTF